MSQIHVTLAGEDLGVIDEERMTLTDAFAIKAASGLSLRPFFGGLNEMDPLSLQTLVWFLRYKQGKAIPLPEVDFVIADLSLEVVPDPPSQPVVTEATSGASETTPSAS